MTLVEAANSGVYEGSRSGPKSLCNPCRYLSDFFENQDLNSSGSKSTIFGFSPFTEPYNLGSSNLDQFTVPFLILEVYSRAHEGIYLLSSVVYSLADHPTTGPTLGRRRSARCVRILLCPRYFKRTQTFAPPLILTRQATLLWYSTYSHGTRTSLKTKNMVIPVSPQSTLYEKEVKTRIPIPSIKSGIGKPRNAVMST